jgi:hypothetical protein
MYQEITESILHNSNPILFAMDSSLIKKFLDTYGSSALVCRYARCPHSSDGFESIQKRKEHEMIHQKRLQCRDTTCEFFISGFAAKSALRAHNRRYHAEKSDQEIPTFRATAPRSAGSSQGIRVVESPYSNSINDMALNVNQTARTPRPPRSMGTNVHSAVAGISTSNALRECTPPPPGVVPGDKKHAPWLELTKYELAKLRKRMKKTAVWSPSDTMILRELKILGRGVEGYRAAKAKAEAAGEPFEYEIPVPMYDASGKKVMAEGEISRADLNQEDRGIELAKLAVEEAEESARKKAEAASAMKDLFAKPPASLTSSTNSGNSSIDSVSDSDSDSDSDSGESI